MEEEKESLRKEAVTVIELKDKEKKHNVVFVKNGIEIGKAWLDHAEFSTNDLLAEDWELCELPFDLDVTLGLWDGIPFDNSEELMAA